MNLLRGIQNLFLFDHDPTTYESCWTDINGLERIVAGLGCGMSCITFDPVQGIFALGCKDGTVVLIGAGWERKLSSSTFPILQLMFKKGDSLLIGVNSKGQVLVWNLIQFQFVHSVNFADPILSVDIHAASPWLVVGFGSGLIKLLDCKSTRLSNYFIPVELGNGQRLVSMQINPTNFNQLLMGFESECLIWSFDEKRPLHRFDFEKGVHLVTCVCWHPNGTELASAYNDGSIAIWTNKKTLLQNLKKSKKTTHLHVFKLGHSIKSLKWNEASSDTSHLYASHSQNVTVLEIKGQKYEKSLGQEFHCIDEVACFLPINTHKFCLVTLATSMKLEFHSHEEIEIPSTLLNLKNGAHLVSCCSEDGFIYINAAKGCQKKTPLVHGGSIMPKNAVRYYNVMSILRDGFLEFWNLTIPLPSFLTMIKLSPVLQKEINTDTRITMDLKKRVLILQTEFRLVLCEFVQQNTDTDDLFEKLDETMAGLESDRVAIRELNAAKEHLESNLSAEEASVLDCDLEMEDISVDSRSASPCNVPLKKKNSAVAKHEIEIASLSDTVEVSLLPEAQGEAAPFDTPKVVTAEAITPDPVGVIAVKPVPNVPNVRLEADNVQDGDSSIGSQSSRFAVPKGIILNQVPTMHIADSQWTTVLEMKYDSPITSYAYDPTLHYLVISMGRLLLVYSTLNNSLPFYYCDVKELLDAPIDPESCISHVAVCTLDHVKCILAFTSPSLFVFQASLTKIKPFVAFNCDQDFGVVLKAEGINSEGKISAEGDNWDTVVVISTHSVALFSDENGALAQSGRRDFEDVNVLNGSMSCIEEVAYVVLVTENQIIVLSLPTLQIQFKFSFDGLLISKLHLSESFITKTGLVGVWMQDNIWKMIRLNSKTKIPSYDSKLYDTLKARRYLDSVGIADQSKINAANELFSPAPANQQPINDIEHVQGESLSLGAQMGNLGNLLAERGEKLNQLQERSGHLANASASFADNIKNFNKAQQKKSWF